MFRLKAYKVVPPIDVCNAHMKTMDITPMKPRYWYLIMTTYLCLMQIGFAYPNIVNEDGIAMMILIMILTWYSTMMIYSKYHID